MNIREAMINDVCTCTASSDLESVAMIMWNEDCGAVPVIDEENRPIAMVTDRDICMATALQHRAPAQIKVSDVIQGKGVETCQIDQDVRDALKVMQRAHVRRLPIVDSNGKLQGILSISDLVTMAPEFGGKEQSLPLPEVLRTMKSVSHHHHQAA